MVSTHVLWMVGLTLAVSSWLSAAQAQTGTDFKVAVQVTDQGESQRRSAYRVALGRLLRQDLPAGLLDDLQRREVLNNADRYVQSFRYRKFQEGADELRLATLQVREGASAGSVIEVAFPADLAGIIQQELLPVAVLEESVVDSIDSGQVLALIAVDQDGAQFLIGGSRGKKFQSRMSQLGAAHSMSFLFPVLDEADSQIVSATDVLYNQTDRLTAVIQKYATQNYLTGGLFRLSADAWQSEWRYSSPGQQLRTINLTTRTLDEALITVITELANESGTDLTPATGLFGSNSNLQRDGIGVRIDNINSLADYQQVLDVLRRIDSTVVTEMLDAGAAVFRATGTSLASLQDSLANQPQFSALPVEQVGVSARFRYR